MSLPARCNIDTLLVSMPFFTARTPSLAIGLLAAVGRRAGFVVDTAHFTVDLAAKLGAEAYEALCLSSGYEVGNWLFSADAFGADDPDPDDRLPVERPDAIGAAASAGLDAAALIRVRREVAPAFLDDLEAGVDWARYGVVGFTTTFHQNVASLALARRLKARFPDLIILFGGANCAGEMGRELVDRCPWIDYAVDGEGEDVFVRLLQALALGEDPAALPGVLSESRASDGPAHALSALDELPLAEFGEFFARAERLGLYSKGELSRLRLPFEASRGCWWGQKHHCTFCGLNGQFMTFRQKSPGRVLDELAELSRRHGAFSFSAVDNIMPHGFWKDLLPALARSERAYDLFFELKSNAGRAEVRLLRESGVRHIQPGIESFNSEVLRLMRKGVTGIQNVNLLRWARYYGVSVAWNILWGFPGEQARHYDAQAGLIAQLAHLQPPAAAARVELQRFSPFHVDRDRFPLRRCAAGEGLRYIYPRSFDLEKLAFYFDYAFEAGLPDAVYAATRDAVETWQGAWASPQPPWLTYRWSPGLLHVEDARDPAAPQLYAFEGQLAEIYRAAADRPASPAMIGASLAEAVSVDELTGVLDLFVDKGLAVRDEGQYLALAIPEGGP